ncbi:hypothetical protein [Pseudoxanthomonas sp. SE1]|uniref:hypothetical protein n=1 Tax=Pseudoxanthomonas sp. SE1 TaxID=1664560 RepID=UPI00240E1D22|nr:hypothetical protein [Pseudoxanthomonas sp. SE1]WFC42287.1 hypothetical protein OY559_01725 [Pseudoxanthomonas sp. SE1]
MRAISRRLRAKAILQRMNEPSDDIDPPIGTLPVLDSGLAAVFGSASPWGLALQQMQGALALLVDPARPEFDSLGAHLSVH